jgi:hypothetical protein
MWMMHLSKWQTERTPRYCSFSFFVLFDKATTVDDSEYHGDDILKILGHVGACLGWYLPWLDSNFPCMTTALVCSDKLKEEVDRPHMAPCYTCPLFIQTTWSRQDFKLSTEIKPGMELLCMLLRNTFVRHEKKSTEGGHQMQCWHHPWRELSGKTPHTNFPTESSARVFFLLFFYLVMVGTWSWSWVLIRVRWAGAPSMFVRHHEVIKSQCNVVIHVVSSKISVILYLLKLI